MELHQASTCIHVLDLPICTLFGPTKNFSRKSYNGSKQFRYRFEIAAIHFEINHKRIENAN